MASSKAKDIGEITPLNYIKIIISPIFAKLIGGIVERKISIWAEV